MPGSRTSAVKEQQESKQNIASARTLASAHLFDLPLTWVEVLEAMGNSAAAKVLASSLWDTLVQKNYDGKVG